MRSSVAFNFRQQLCVAAMMFVVVPASLGAQFLRKSAPTPPADTLVSIGSPRAAVKNYLRLAEAGDWEGAAEYLVITAETPARREQLARRLKSVLDQRLALNMSAISSLVRGDTTDGDAAGDRIGLITGPTGRQEPVRLIRIDSAGTTRWAFGPGTVADIDRWYEMMGSPWLREQLPSVLMEEGPLHLYYWQWIGLLLAIPLLMLVTWVVATVVHGVMKRAAARTHTDWDDILVMHLGGPFRLWVAALAAAPLSGILELNASASQFVSSLSRGLVLLAMFWGLLRIIRIGQHRLENSAWNADDGARARTLVPLLGNLLKVTVAIVALLVALAQFGYPVGTLLAGLGIGGIAIALAAQKTVEHLFGSISLAADRAFRVGDWVRAGTTEGAVERIGLRSTSFRTHDRTVVRIPNGRLAEERIETFGERDRMMLRTNIDLLYSTSPDTLDAIRNDLEKVIRAHPLHWPDMIRVNVVAFADSAIRLDVLAWFESPTWDQFLRIRHNLLLEFMRIVHHHGSDFAFPSRTIYHVQERDGAPSVPGSSSSPHSASMADTTVGSIAVSGSSMSVPPPPDADNPPPN